MEELTPPPGESGRRFYETFAIWLSLVGIFLVTLAVNGYPIIDHDSQRYLPTLIGPPTFSLSPQRASIIPLLLNEVPFRPFGIMGIPIFTSIVMAWALTLFLRELARVFVDEPLRGRFCLWGVVIVALLSFLPVTVISVLSEPWSVIAFALALTCFLSRTVSWPLASALLLAGASHSTNVIIIGAAALASTILSRFDRDSLKVSLIVVVILVSGSVLDRALFTLTEGHSPRVRYSFVGAAILNFYPKIYDDFCGHSPDSLLCRQTLRDFVTRNRRPLDYSKSRFLWSPTRICRDLPGVAALPDEAMISLEDYERESAAIVRFAARDPLAYGPYILGIVSRKIAALFMRSDVYSHPYNLTVHSVRAPWEASLMVRSSGKSPDVMFACSLSRLLVLGLFILGVMWLLLRRGLDGLSQSQRDAIVLVAVMYVTNLLIYGSIEAALSRYHYRAYFLLPLITYALLLRLWLQRR